MAAINVTSARDQLSHLVDLVEKGEVIPLTRNGKTVAAIVPLDVVPDELLAAAVLMDSDEEHHADAVRDHWEAIMTRLKERSIVVWARLSADSRLISVDGQRVTLGFSGPVQLKSFKDAGSHKVLAAAISDTLGGTWRVESILSS